jgi:repressor LexA
METRLAANLGFLLAERGMTQRELAAASGISLNTISRWCNSRATRPSRSAIGAVARALGVTAHELTHVDLTGRSESAGPAPSEVGRSIPVISDVPAGDPAEMFDEFPEGHGYEQVTCPADLSDRNAFALRLSGDSLEPRFSDGDIAIVSPNRSHQERDLVVAKIGGESVTCKYIRTRGETVTLSPGNPQYDPRILDRSELRWVYPVVYVIKRLK